MRVQGNESIIQKKVREKIKKEREKGVVTKRERGTDETSEIWSTRRWKLILTDILG